MGIRFTRQPPHHRLEAEELKRHINVIPAPNHLVCRYCGSLFRPGNHTARVLPKMKVNRVLERLVQRRVEQDQLSKFQRKMANMYSKTTNRLVLRCQMCRRRTIISCQGRREKIVPVKPSKVVPLTYAEKRKQKKREKRRLKSQQQNSSPDTPQRSAISSDSGISSTSTISLSHSMADSQVSLLPRMTSTPIANSSLSRSYSKNNSTPTRSAASFTSGNSSASVTPGCATVSSLNSSNSSIGGMSRLSQLSTDGSSKPSGGGRKKKGKGGVHNVLQKMLANEKARKEDSSSLHQFLSSL